MYESVIPAAIPEMPSWMTLYQPISILELLWSQSNTIQWFKPDIPRNVALALDQMVHLEKPSQASSWVSFPSAVLVHSFSHISFFSYI